MNRADQLLQHKKILDAYVKQRNHHLSCYHFSSIFLWQDFFEFAFETIDDHLCIFAKHSLGHFLYLPPLGKAMNVKTIEQCFSRLNALNSKRTFSRIENMSESDVFLLDPSKYRSTMKSHEYCYFKNDLITLQGNAYKSKRSSYNQFIRSYPHKFVVFDDRWIKDCLELYDAWAQDRRQRSDDAVYHAMLEENRGVHERIFQWYDELGLEGRVVLVEGKPQAYTFGYPLNDTTFCVLVEITNLEIKGLSVYIFSRLCADEAVKDFKFINVMDDFAMANIAKTKASFKPNILFPSYVITEN